MNSQKISAFFEQYGKAIFLCILMTFVTWIFIETLLERGNYFAILLIVIALLFLIYAYIAEARQKPTDQSAEKLLFWKNWQRMGISAYFMVVGWSAIMKAIENDNVIRIIVIAVCSLYFLFILIKGIWLMTHVHNTPEQPV